MFGEFGEVGESDMFGRYLSRFGLGGLEAVGRTGAFGNTVFRSAELDLFDLVGVGVVVHALGGSGAGSGGGSPGLGLDGDGFHCRPSHHVFGMGSTRSHQAFGRLGHQFGGLVCDGPRHCLHGPYAAVLKAVRTHVRDHGDPKLQLQ